MNNLVQKIKFGLFFKFAERIGAQGINFIVTIILARILLPVEFGLISLVAVFIALLDVFVTYGFGNSLIVNKNSDNVDFSTCFYFGGLFSVVVYCVLYICSPILASYFDNENLSTLIKVMGLRVPVAAINSVQHAYVSKHMMFKKFFISTSIGTTLSGVISIIMAYNGYGVWALVAQYLGSSLFDAICLWYIVSWRPIIAFSFSRLKNIYDYGWKILVVGLIDTLYSQIRSLVVAKGYSAVDLAYYSRGFQFPTLFVNIIEPTINEVIFPALSACNDSLEEMRLVTRRMIQLSSYTIFPLLIGLVVTAEPFVRLLLTDKWLECVIFIQIGCLAFLFRPVQVINNCLIKASGRSSLLLKLDIIKKTVGVILLVVSIPFGVEVIAWSFVLANFISTMINIYPNAKLINYGFFEQIMDICNSLFISIIMGIGVYSIMYFQLPPLVTLFIQIIFGIGLYLFMSILTKNKSYKYIKLLIIKTKKDISV